MSLSEDVEELRVAVLSLASRVTDLSHSLNTVNDVQVRQIEQEKETRALEKEARGAANKAERLQSSIIPREEHERRWKKEQEALIALRLKIRKQTYVIGGAFFFLSIIALGVTTGLIFHNQSHLNDARKEECQFRVHNSQLAVNSYGDLLTSPTIAHDGTLHAFIQTAYDAAVRGSQIKC